MPRRRSSRGNSASKNTPNSRSNKAEKNKSSGNNRSPERPRPKDHQTSARHRPPMGMPSSKDDVVHSAPGVDRRQLLIRNMPGDQLKEVHSHLEAVLQVKVKMIRWDPLFPDLALVSLESEMERDITECRVELYRRPLNNLCLEVDSVGVTRGVLLRNLPPSTADVDIRNQLPRDVTWRMALYVDINMAVVLFACRKDSEAALDKLRRVFKHAEPFHDSFHNEEIKARLQLYQTPRILSSVHKVKPAQSKEKEPKKSSWMPWSKANSGKEGAPPGRKDSECIAGEEVGRPYGVEDENYAWRRSSVDQGSTVDPADVNKNKARLAQSLIVSPGDKSVAVQRSMSYPGEEGGRVKQDEGIGSKRSIGRSGEGGERGKYSREEAGKGKRAGEDERKGAAESRAHGNDSQGDRETARDPNRFRKVDTRPQSDFEYPEEEASNDDTEISNLSRKMDSDLQIKESERPLSPQPDYDRPSTRNPQETEAEEEKDHDHNDTDDNHDAEDDHGSPAKEGETLFHKNEPWRLIPPEIDGSDQEQEKKRTDPSDFVFSDEEDPDDLVELIEVSGAAVKLLEESNYFKHFKTCRVNVNSQSGHVVLEGQPDAVAAARFELEDTIDTRIVTERFRVSAAAKQLLDTYMGREWITQHVGGDYRSSRVVTDLSEDGIFSCCSFEKYQAEKAARALQRGIHERYLTLPEVQSEEWQEKWKAAMKSINENLLLNVAAEKDNPSHVVVAGFGNDDVDVANLQLQHLIEEVSEVQTPPSPESPRSNPDPSSKPVSRGRETVL